MAVKKVENFNIHETPAINQNEFDVETYLNANWGKTKEAVNNNAEELMQGDVPFYENHNYRHCRRYGIWQINIYEPFEKVFWR